MKNDHSLQHLVGLRLFKTWWRKKWLPPMGVLIILMLSRWEVGGYAHHLLIAFCINGMEGCDRRFNVACRHTWSLLPYIFGQANHYREDIVSSLSQGNTSLFSNPIVNKAWILVGDFIVWTLWKEINSWIFRNKRRHLKVVKEMIIQNGINFSSILVVERLEGG